MKILIWFTAIISFTVMTACSYGPDSPKGFSLPEGNMAGNMAGSDTELSIIESKMNNI